jgi:hypothetical protein
VTIGDEAVIGTGALVTKDVPARCLAYGVPARVERTDLDKEAMEASENADSLEAALMIGRKGTQGAAEEVRRVSEYLGTRFEEKQKKKPALLLLTRGGIIAVVALALSFVTSGLFAGVLAIAYRRLGDVCHSPVK